VIDSLTTHSFSHLSLSPPKSIRIMGIRLLHQLFLVILTAMNKGQSLVCYSNLTSISVAEFNVKDLRIRRKYILCPNTKFETPEMDPTGWFLGSLPLILRSNAIVQCGFDGSSDNLCVIDGTGTHGIIIEPHAFGFTDSSTRNVIIQGITVDSFAPNKFYSSPVTLGLTNGDVTFMDCIFSNNFGDSIFTIQQYAFSRRLFQDKHNQIPAGIGGTRNNSAERKSKSTLKFTFNSCIFKVRSIQPCAFLFLTVLNLYFRITRVQQNQ
jgi:hypothetical protein